MPTAQQPINSGFRAANTAEDVIQGINLTGKTAIVTGGYAGLGLETARVLHLAGAHVIVPARDIPKARKALADFPGIEIEALDLLDPASVNAFAERFLAKGLPLHILVNSAGIMANPLTRDARGYESQFATNHLGHYQLVTRLWPALKSANGARVVSVSSAGHRFGPVDFDDPNFEHREYTPWAGYGQSKTANILFARELDWRGEAFGIRAFSVHPGTILDTDLKKFLTEDQIRNSGAVDENGETILDPMRQLKTVQQGASTSVWCAVAESLNGLGGVYCENNNISRVVSPEKMAERKTDEQGQYGVLAYAVDPANADRLWTLSEQLTGVSL
ncbi:MAG: SDR family NAD(P)-dependent oxidoreductase [Bacteroidota bacterium]